MSVAEVKKLPLRRFVRILGGGTPSTAAENWGGDIPFATPRDLRLVNGGHLRTTERTLTVSGIEVGSTLAPEGSVMLSIRAPIGYTSLVDVETAFSQGCKALVPDRSRVLAAFLQYALHTESHVLEMSANGTTFQELSTGALSEIPISVPEMHQQSKIVRFLDVETAKIDHLITKQRELLDLLNLRHEARWHVAFTGFTPVKTRPLKRLLVKQNRPVAEGLGVVTAFRDGEVTLRSKRREEGFTFSETEAGYQGIKQGDLVFHGLDGFAGAVGISDSDGQSTPVYHVCRQRDDEDDLRFIAYALRYLGHSGFLATQAPSVRQRAVDFRNWQTFGQVPLSLPDGEEQQRIVADLDSHAAALADTTVTIERAITLLQERRSALITAAVTGQIEV